MSPSTNHRSAVGISWTLGKANRQNNAFLLALSQYPVFEGIVSHLRPADLIPLLQTCQMIHKLLNLQDKKAKANVLSKTLCAGRGLNIRFKRHRPDGTEGPNWHCAVYCGGAADNNRIEHRPCVSCGVNTCDECRIHVTYQLMLEEPGLGDRLWWAGFAFLDPSVISFFPPTVGDTSTWYLPHLETHNDEGSIHIPFSIPIQAAAAADPEPIERLLDVDLGRHKLSSSGRVTAPYQGWNVIALLNTVVLSRKEYICEDCFEELEAGEPNNMCGCTLRDRFVDRWVCLPCYKAEEDSDIVLKNTNHVCFATGQLFHGECSVCEVRLLGIDSYRTICNWCDGYIVEEEEEDDEAETDEDSGTAQAETQDEDGSTNDDQDDDNWHGPNTGTHEPGCQIPAFMTDDEGGLYMRLAHKTVRGECLGRAVYEELASTTKQIDAGEMQLVGDIEVADMD